MVEIVVPALRDRREDIPLLVKHFVAKSSRNQNASEKALSTDALSYLVNFDWPGNVRELENAVERAVILSGDEISLDSLPQKVLKYTRNVEEASNGPKIPTLDEIERRYVLDTLKNAQDDKVAAAGILGIDLSTLYRKLKKYEGE